MKMLWSKIWEMYLKWSMLSKVSVVMVELLEDDVHDVDV